MKAPREGVRQWAASLCCLLYLAARLLLTVSDSGEGGNFDSLFLGAPVAFLFGWFVVPWALSPLLKRLDAKRAAKERRQHRRRHRRSRHAGAQAPPSGETAADTSDPL